MKRRAHFTPITRSAIFLLFLQRKNHTVATVNRAKVPIEIPEMVPTFELTGDFPASDWEWGAAGGELDARIVECSVDVMMEPATLVEDIVWKNEVAVVSSLLVIEGCEKEETNSFVSFGVCRDDEPTIECVGGAKDD